MHSTAMRVPLCAGCRAFARSISFHPRTNKAAKGKRAKKVVDLGWDGLTARLNEAPLALPNLRSLTIEHGKTGAEQTGARKFKALLPPLRWQNPDAEITTRWLDDPGPPRVVLELHDGTQEFHVSGKRSEEILENVLQEAGAPAETIAPSVSWAKRFLQDS